VCRQRMAGRRFWDFVLSLGCRRVRALGAYLKASVLVLILVADFNPYHHEQRPCKRSWFILVVRRVVPCRYRRCWQ